VFYSPSLFPKNQRELLKEIRLMIPVPGTTKDRKKRGLSADLRSYHDGALPGSCVEDPFSQTQ
jgi:hypothetical protein